MPAVIRRAAPERTPHVAGAAHEDCLTEQAAGPLNGEQRRAGGSACRLSCEGHAGRVTAERCDVVVDPLQALPMFITIAVIRILASRLKGRRDSLAVAVTESRQTGRNNDASR
jgi:hypothetical protein